MHAVDCENLELALEVVDLREVAAPVIQMFDGMSARHPVSLESPNEPLMLRADVDRLQRVIENLIANAIKYSPYGGNVRVSLVAEGDHAVLSVRDEGIGISACALQHIFERGYRAPEAKAVAPGLGLGLSTSEAILRRHGGVVQLSRAEKGSIASVRLPLVSVASRSAARSKSQPKARHSPERAQQHSA
jgi:signal transduction histidine kinase